MLKQFERVSFAGMLVTLGIVYGDIGTSPLYVMNAIVGDAGLIFSYVGAKLYEAPADIIKCSSFFLLKLS